MEGKIIAVLPISNGNGGKYIATNLAHYQKNQNGKKVALVDFDIKNPFLANALTNDEIHGVDNLIDKIDGNLLDEELFKENMITLKNNVDLLKGTKLIGNYKLFNKNHVDSILNLLKSMYDVIYVSIVADTNNAFSIYSLFEADEVIVVSRNNQATVKSFDRVMEIINLYRSKSSKINIVHNMYNSISKTEVASFINKYGLNVLGLISYEEESVDNMNLIDTGFKFLKSKNKSKNEEIFINMIRDI